MKTATRAEEVALLRRRIKESELSTSRFAVEVLIRDPRTVRRWVTGDGPISQRVLEWLQASQVAPWPASTAITHLRDRLQDTGVCDVCGAPDLNR